MADSSKLSPMMAQYLETKKQYPDCILFYRIGDFYEMFYRDAQLASEELDLVLTGKDCGLEERAPMCGIPFHAAENYITRLVKKGYKVAIGEQVEDPKLAKGLVKREVIRIITPGTLTESGALEDSKNNYLMSAAYLCDVYGIAVLDAGTGEFLFTQVSDRKEFLDEYSRFLPSELIFNEAFAVSGIGVDELVQRANVTVTRVPASYYDEDGAIELLKSHFQNAPEALAALSGPEIGLIAAGAALRYIYDTQFSTVSNITELSAYDAARYMIIDSATLRNLELLETIRDKEKKGSLLWVLDKTGTAMGGRLLRQYITRPLLSREEILHRQDAVKVLNEHFIDREEISEYLRSIYDFERLMSRICTERANPRDLLAFRQSLSMVGPIKRLVRSFESDAFSEIEEELNEFAELRDRLDRALSEDAPVSVRDGGIFRDGFDPQIDHLRGASKEGKQWLLQLEQEERDRTGIKTLKVKFNKVFGYCIEVTNTFKDLVPDDYIRKQTLAGGERYTTDRLEELAESILGADDKLKGLENQLFLQLLEEISALAPGINKMSRAIARLDVLKAFSVTASKYGYVCPSINEKGSIDIRDGRHPVVERMLSGTGFVPNDTQLDMGSRRVAVITGPNMAGKSTYMRQTALIVLMAQIGSFVPASRADICICDRIFTRVGASDDLASGQSTFMVEMNEVANILKNATPKSLLILDEIGRGTSTFDGLSIAWAVVEYISDKKRLGAKTLFATHYHELTELEGRLSGVQNYCIAVKEKNDELVFLRKIIPGGADRSYGIEVARLAGVPDEITDRAREIAEQLEESDLNHRQLPTIQKAEDRGKTQAPMMRGALQDNERSVLDTIRTMNPSAVTPIEALLLLDELKGKLEGKA